MEKNENTVEHEINPKSVAVVTTTFYPKWNEATSADRMRGNLNLEFIEETKRKGYQLVVVDGGSSPLFIKELKEKGCTPSPETEHGMSGSRRQAFREGGALESAEIIVWIEPEKVSMVRSCLPEAVRPIFNNEADIVIPQRDEEAFKSYPDYQASFEKKGK